MYTFLNRVMPHWVKTPSTKSHILCDKNLGDRHGKPPLVGWENKSHSKWHVLLPLLLVTFHNVRVRPCF